MLGFYVHKLAAYEYCPARYRLEHSRITSQPTNKFEVFQLLFKQYFRIMQNSIMNTNKIRNIILDYSDILFPKGENVQTELMVAYTIKCFENLYFNVIQKGIYFLPNTFIFETDDVAIKLATDLIFSDSVYEEKSSYKYRQRINFVYLVPNEYWDSISLSNRLEIYVTHQYLFQQLKKDDLTQYKIIFVNAETGALFSILKEDIKTLAADKSRLTKIISDIKDKKFLRTPVGALCSRCPKYNKCNPRNYKA